MAFLPTYDDETEKREVDQVGARMTPMAAGPAAAGGAPQPTAAPMISAPGGAASPGPFVNFSRYIDANRDVANQTAQSVASTVGKAADTAQKGLQGAQAGFQQGMQAGSPFGAPQVNRLAPRGPATAVNPLQRFQNQPQAASIAAPSTVTPRAGVLQQGLQGAPQKGSSAGQISIDEARKRAGAKYTGPQGLNVSDQLRQQTAAAASQLGQTQTDPGRQALLQQQYGRGGGYTAGANRLDGALVGSVGGNQFRDLRAKYGDLGGQLDAAQTAARAQAAAAGATTDTQAANYGTQVGKYDTDELERQKLADAKAQQAVKVREQQQLDVQQQQRTQASKDRTPVGDQVTSMTDDHRAAVEGHQTEWRAAGSPPYDEWKAAHGY